MGTTNYRERYGALLENAFYSPVVAERLRQVLDGLGYLNKHLADLTDAECKKVVLAYRQHLRKKSKTKGKR